MSCQAPPARWRAGLLQPVNTILWIGGLVCLVAGVVLTDGVASLLPQVGGVLFLVGTSGGVVTAHGLGSLLKVVDGSRARIEALTKECTDQQPRMHSIAELLCSDAAVAHRIVELTTTEVARVWTRGVGTEFTLFLLCRTISVARTVEGIHGQENRSEAGADRERRLILTLHQLCGIPSSQIAPMLDFDEQVVRAALIPPGPRGSGI